MPYCQLVGATLLTNQLAMKTRNLFGWLTLGLFLVTSCGEETTQKETPQQEAQVQEPVSDTAYVVIQGNDRMMYDTKHITVHQGQIVVLTLKHVGKASKDVMGHNFVLLDNGITISEFGQLAAAAAATDYIPEEARDKVIAHTKMIGGGEEDVIIFQAPPKGLYDFLCSFPGHYSMMKGEFHVK